MLICHSVGGLVKGQLAMLCKPWVPLEAVARRLIRLEPWKQRKKPKCFVCSWHQTRNITFHAYKSFTIKNMNQIRYLNEEVPSIMNEVLACTWRDIAIKHDFLSTKRITCWTATCRAYLALLYNTSCHVQTKDFSLSSPSVHSDPTAASTQEVYQVVCACCDCVVPY